MNAPAWQRWLLCSGLLAGGLVLIAFGLSGLLEWIVALSKHASIIDTESGMFGMPLIGISLCAIGGSIPFAGMVRRGERWTLGLWLTALPFAGFGILLAATGPFIVDPIMQQHLYRACSSSAGIRTQFVTWARNDRPCPVQ